MILNKFKIYGKFQLSLVNTFEIMSKLALLKYKKDTRQRKIYKIIKKLMW